MNRGQVAARVTRNKELHPEQFCPVRNCLWRTGDGSYCPKHKDNRVVAVNLCPVPPAQEVGKCPWCGKNMTTTPETIMIGTVINELLRCAKQNEFDSAQSINAKVVAGEQRRMIKVLRRLQRDIRNWVENNSNW